MNLKSIITCPSCAHSKEETMPQDSCLYLYRCLNCGKTIKPKPGGCCVFCSYGTEKCPSKQIEKASNEWRCGRLWLAWGIGTALMMTLSFGVWSHATKQMRERTVEVTETLRLQVPLDGHRLRLWIPRPANDEYQSVQLLKVRSAWPHRLTRDPDFGNELLYMEAVSPEPQTVNISVLYRIVRREQNRREGPGQETVSPFFREPRGLVVVNDEIRRIAREAAGSLQDPMEKARAFYGYVLGHMRYDKTGEGWGRGDALYACRVGKGNCTDFHTLFMALSLAEGVPVRFLMGYPLPKKPTGTVEAPYHCWAEFYAEGRGWIPVDISEAWKHPERAENYFGHLDKDRVLISVGRELRLSPLQDGPPLNYMSQPYVEMNGQAYQDFEWERTYKDLQ